MNSYDSYSGKILLHGAETGEITRSMIDHRAHEIALIDGRATVTAADRRLARQDLEGRDLPDTTSDDSPTIALALSRDPSEPVSVPGHQTPFYSEIDDDVTERLAIGGIEEAQHDQMLAARRRRNS